ncbi:hypothetical protein [Bacillus mycoides]|uniref:Uncharacterized protein n=1 Tax=Bacillus mycoides (strain KBAB4) TaxID=315730 RepID=A9VV00_BACMK|nr:hypothetical protein [Bacillus mycoides]ABY46432.1 hypothetical protein BcerKBAB4_5440 [Bacillus mycoides KBAB4]PEK88289.1 hypothetical protein CN600_27430 [Bacillus mycoides]
MAKTLATGMISIVDFNDAPSLSAFVSTTSPKTQIYDPASGTYTPNWTSAGPTLTPSLFISTEGTTDAISSAKAVKWYDSIDTSKVIVTGGAYTVTGNTLKISQNIMTGSTYAKTFIAEIIWTDPTTLADLVVRAEFTFSRADNGKTGASAISAVLSNDSDVIPTDSAGNNGNFTGAISTMTIFEGATDVSASWTVAANPVDITGTLSGKTYTVTGFVAGKDTGYVDLTASKSGYASVTRRFALSKSKQGISGTTPTLYRLLSSADAIQKNLAGVYTPTTIIFTAKSQTGSGAYGDYSGKFTIEETTDGTTFTNKYTSASNEPSKIHTPSAGIKAIRVRLHIAGVTPNGSNHIDEQTISVVSDGATGVSGADAVLVSVWAPNGNLFKNDLSTSLTAQADLYKGATVQSSGVTYEWFVQKSGNADEGAGTGWDKIDATNQASYGVTGAVNTATITVTAAGITNLAAFKIKATYSSKAYYDTIIFYDQTDPIMVSVESSNGNIFKNGSVSSQILCRLFQNGEEIDPKLASATTGYKYTYTWTKLKMDGTQDMDFGGKAISTKTGKWIDITDADIFQKAVFKVEIS